ncbi:MAG: hypothetical protein Q8P31_00140 [Bacillota bacterium]|nr:hypothetical protein [Bacillota bacterium]
MDKDQIKAILEAVTEALRGLQTDDEPEVNAAVAEVEYGSHRKTKDKCEVPRLVLYFIFTECVTINNGACPDWEFCDDDKKRKK